MRERMIGVTEARAHFKDLLDELPARSVIILKNNRPVAVLVAPERLERLLDRVEELEDQVAILETQLHPEPRLTQEEVEGGDRQAADAG